MFIGTCEQIRSDKKSTLDGERMQRYVGQIMSLNKTYLQQHHWLALQTFNKITKQEQLSAFYSYTYEYLFTQRNLKWFSVDVTLGLLLTWSNPVADLQIKTFGRQIFKRINTETNKLHQ